MKALGRSLEANFSHMNKRHFLKNSLLFAALLVGWPLAGRAQDAAPAAAPTGAAALPTVWLIGDSTVSIGVPGLRGWGNELVAYFDPARIYVVNRARGGRSSRAFFNEGLWDKLLKEVKPGDFVLMQFGHEENGTIEGEPPSGGRASLAGSGDETRLVARADGTTETVHSFGWYLRRFAAGIKAQGAAPVLLSPTPRSVWQDGRVLRPSESYGLWAKEAAQAEGVPFVDLGAIVADRYDALGQDQTKPFFPKDDIHTSVEGAQLNAQAVIAGLKALPHFPLPDYFSEEAAAVSPYAGP